MPKTDQTADAAEEQTSEAAKPGKVRELSRATRDGQTTRVLTDDVRVWKETAEVKGGKA